MTIEQILYCTLSYAPVRRSNSLKKVEHCSIRIWCVKRTVMRQPSEYEINSRVSLFLLFGPSCVNRLASKYELALKISALHYEHRVRYQ